jgi:hypothetical protein
MTGFGAARFPHRSPGSTMPAGRSA